MKKPLLICALGALSLTLILALASNERSYPERIKHLSPMDQNVSIQLNESPPFTAFTKKESNTRELSASEEAFQWLARRTLEDLPKREQLEDLNPAEVEHHTPALVHEAGERKIAEQLQQDPRLKPMGGVFYRECALDADQLTSVRSLCLVHALELGAMKDLTPEELASQLTGEVLQTARRLAQE